MMDSRRNALSTASSKQSDHAGLWLDKYLAKQLNRGESIRQEQQAPQQTLVEETAAIAEPEDYAAYFQRWQNALRTCGAQTQEAEIEGRMVIGLGDEGVLETAITLHHTYGVPYIPGSALKGLTASFARQRLSGWQPSGEAYTTLFGNTDVAGYVTFFDALYVPGSGRQQKALYADVLTVHHPDYYQKGDSPPADWDSPTPIPFLSATGKYLIALGGPEEWVQAAFTILALALEEAGVGAKTSSGYGRLRFAAQATAPRTLSEPTVTHMPEADPGQARVDALIRDLKALPSARVAPEINRFIERWRKLNVSDALKRQAAQAIVQKVREAGREKASADKAWYQELLASIEE